MTSIPKFNNQSIETISLILGEIVKGSTITRMFNNLNLEDNSLESTKWKRLNFVINKYQNIYDCGNKTLEIIEYIFHPTSTWFMNLNDYNENIKQINKCISFYGLELNENGKIHESSATNSKVEANERYDLLKSKLDERNTHLQIMKFCTIDIVNEDYFSIIMEASKSIYDRVRYMTNINQDGNRLINTCFDLKYPIIVFNSLSNDNEVNLYNGLKNIILSIGQIGRNPRAHMPKIYSYDDLDNCLDILNIISFSHKMLDKYFINKSALDKFMESQ